MLPRLILALPLLALPHVTLAAGHQDEVDRLISALMIPELIEVMSDEGISYADDIALGMFPDRAGSPDWDGVVAQIYDPATMLDRVRTDFTEALDGADVAGMISFYESDLGRKAIGLELSARQAMLDESVDEAAREASALAALDDTARHQQITRFVEANDLIESNVMGGMNSNYAYYLGLLDGGALDPSVTQEQLLSDVWAQEEGVRQSTGDWVYSFLTMAYQPLTDAELDAYTAFSETATGQQMNRALFSGFDGMFDDISYALGFAAAQMMVGAEL